jgi:uncharacterized protein YigE (DUF2233 family)
MVGYPKIDRATGSNVGAGMSAHKLQPPVRASGALALVLLLMGGCSTPPSPRQEQDRKGDESALATPTEALPAAPARQLSDEQRFGRALAEIERLDPQLADAFEVSRRAAALGPFPEGIAHRSVVHAHGLWDVFEIDLAQVELLLLGQANPELRTLAAVRAAHEAAGRTWGMATNGGMFHAGERPVGLHVEAGHELAPLELGSGSGNFFMKPNGVFYLDAAGAHVVDSTAYQPEGEVVLATQSGPLLVSRSALHPEFDPASTHLKKRSGVGVRDPSHVVFAISRAEVSFHAFATLFRDVLGCADALYLDGSISDFDAPGMLAARRPEKYGSVLTAVAKGR